MLRSVHSTENPSPFCVEGKYKSRTKKLKEWEASRQTLLSREVNENDVKNAPGMFDAYKKHSLLRNQLKIRQSRKIQDEMNQNQSQGPTPGFSALENPTPSITLPPPIAQNKKIKIVTGVRRAWSRINEADNNPEEAPISPPPPEPSHPFKDITHSLLNTSEPLSVSKIPVSIPSSPLPTVEENTTALSPSLPPKGTNEYYAALLTSTKPCNAPSHAHSFHKDENLSAAISVLLSAPYPCPHPIQSSPTATAVLTRESSLHSLTLPIVSTSRATLADLSTSHPLPPAERLPAPLVAKEISPPLVAASIPPPTLSATISSAALPPVPSLPSPPGVAPLVHSLSDVTKTQFDPSFIRKKILKLKPSPPRQVNGVEEKKKPEPKKKAKKARFAEEEDESHSPEKKALTQAKKKEAMKLGSHALSGTRTQKMSKKLDDRINNANQNHKLKKMYDENGNLRDEYRLSHILEKEKKGEMKGASGQKLMNQKLQYQKMTSQSILSDPFVNCSSFFSSSISYATVDPIRRELFPGDAIPLFQSTNEVDKETKEWQEEEKENQEANRLANSLASILNSVRQSDSTDTPLVPLVAATAPPKKPVVDPLVRVEQIVNQWRREEDSNLGRLGKDEVKPIGKMKDLCTQLLKECFKFDTFRPYQLETMISVLCEKKKALFLSHTGSGKSLTYQLPSIIFARHFKKITIVVSPLLSLMEDQLQHINKHIRAALLSSNINFKAVRVIEHMMLTNQLDLVYVTPERLQTNFFMHNRALREKIGMICIDEAHCISEWSHHFRPSYLQMHQFLSLLSPQVPILGLTASGTINTIKDLINILHVDTVIASYPLNESALFEDNDSNASHNEQSYSHKKESYFSPRKVGAQKNADGCEVEYKETDELRNEECRIASPFSPQALQERMRERRISLPAPQKKVTLLMPGSFNDGKIEHSLILRENIKLTIEKTLDVDKAILELLMYNPTWKHMKSVIVYVWTQYKADSLAQVLNSQLNSIHQGNKGNSRRVLSYHSNKPMSERRHIIDQFEKNQVNIIVSTIAFGMGINKLDIDGIIHATIPKSIEQYVQETGRVARLPGSVGHCHLMLFDDEFIKLKNTTQASLPNSRLQQQFVSCLLSNSSQNPALQAQFPLQQWQTLAPLNAFKRTISHDTDNGTSVYSKDEAKGIPRAADIAAIGEVGTKKISVRHMSYDQIAKSIGARNEDEAKVLMALMNQFVLRYKKVTKESFYSANIASLSPVREPLPTKQLTHLKRLLESPGSDWERFSRDNLSQNSPLITPVKKKMRTQPVSHPFPNLSSPILSNKPKIQALVSDDDEYVTPPKKNNLCFSTPQKNRPASPVETVGTMKWPPQDANSLPPPSSPLPVAGNKPKSLSIGENNHPLLQGDFDDCEPLSDSDTSVVTKSLKIRNQEKHSLLSNYLFEDLYNIHQSAPHIFSCTLEDFESGGNDTSSPDEYHQFNEIRRHLQPILVELYSNERFQKEEKNIIVMEDMALQVQIRFFKYSFEVLREVSPEFFGIIFNASVKNKVWKSRSGVMTLNMANLVLYTGWNGNTVMDALQCCRSLDLISIEKKSMGVILLSFAPHSCELKWEQREEKKGRTIEKGRRKERNSSEEEIHSSEEKEYQVEKKRKKQEKESGPTLIDWEKEKREFDYRQLWNNEIGEETSTHIESKKKFIHQQDIEKLDAIFIALSSVCTIQGGERTERNAGEKRHPSEGDDLAETYNGKKSSEETTAILRFMVQQYFTAPPSISPSLLICKALVFAQGELAEEIAKLEEKKKQQDAPVIGRGLDKSAPVVLSSLVRTPSSLSSSLTTSAPPSTSLLSQKTTNTLLGARINSTLHQRFSLTSKILKTAPKAAESSTEQRDALQQSMKDSLHLTQVLFNKFHMFNEHIKGGALFTEDEETTVVAWNTYIAYLESLFFHKINVDYSRSGSSILGDMRNNPFMQKVLNAVETLMKGGLRNRPLQVGGVLMTTDLDEIIREEKSKILQGPGGEKKEGERGVTALDVARILCGQSSHEFQYQQMSGMGNSFMRTKIMRQSKNKGFLYGLSNQQAGAGANNSMWGIFRMIPFSFVQECCHAALEIQAGKIESFRKSQRHRLRMAMK